MGACDFECSGKGKTASEAFESLVEDARYQHGHGGYTGTIAEKTSFKMIGIPDSFKLSHEGKSEREVASLYAEHLMEVCDPRINDKWGDAGCIKVVEGEYLFFGFASS